MISNHIQFLDKGVFWLDAYSAHIQVHSYELFHYQIDAYIDFAYVPSGTCSAN